MLQGCRIGHLDRPYGNWIRSVTSNPGKAMRLGKQHGVLSPGGAADFIIFRGRRYSELLARPQVDRVVVRNGKAINAILPDYVELDYVPLAIKSGDIPVEDMQFQKDALISSMNIRIGKNVTRNRNMGGKGNNGSMHVDIHPRSANWNRFSVGAVIFAIFSSVLLSLLAAACKL